jgi:hypothetical protein
MDKQMSGKMEAARDSNVNMWQCLVGNFNISGNFCLRKRTTIVDGFTIDLYCTVLS